MLLFRGKWHTPSSEITVLIYAENEYDAARYLKTLPLYWHLPVKPEDFEAIEAPKGSSPSVLLDNVSSFAGAD